MLDTGLVHDGYFCDFDRNFAIMHAHSLVRDAHKRLIEATQNAFAIARSGICASDLFHAMDKVLTGGKAPKGAGRLGHGLGMELTEWPSLISTDRTVLQAGMVLTLEPSVATRRGHFLTHEENIVITDKGARYLSSAWDSELSVLS
ncbi:MAG: M24 family metallopeptidase [Pseudomonadota bacterium]